MVHDGGDKRAHRYTRNKRETCARLRVGPTGGPGAVPLAVVVRGFWLPAEAPPSGD